MKTAQQTWNTGQFGIVNAKGDPWTPRTWGTREAAQKYLAEQALQKPTWQLGQHQVVPVSVTVRCIKSK